MGGGDHSCSNLKLAMAVLYLGSRVPQQHLCLSVPESSLGSCKPRAKTAIRPISLGYTAEHLRVIPAPCLTHTIVDSLWECNPKESRAIVNNWMREAINTFLTDGKWAILHCSQGRESMKPGAGCKYIFFAVFGGCPLNSFLKEKAV